MNSVLKMNAAQTTQPLIAIYCGSRMGNHPIYQQATLQLCQGLAQRGLGLVYGGASIGLMGQVADTFLAHGGEAVGVIPEFMLNYEIAHANLTELHVVTDMHERKALMADRARAFIALPGGLGTFEEILEVATWGQLEQHQKPMMLYNINGFYDALIRQLDHAVQEGFLPAQHRAKVQVCNSAEEIYHILEQLHRPQTNVS